MEIDPVLHCTFVHQIVQKKFFNCVVSKLYKCAIDTGLRKNSFENTLLKILEPCRFISILCQTPNKNDRSFCFIG